MTVGVMQPLLGIGAYTAGEASRLTGISAPRLRRWLAGYHYRLEERSGEQPPLWTPQHDGGEALTLGFRDLIEARFVNAFVNAGLSLFAIRQLLDHARDVVGDTHPLSTKQFQTDGRTLFLEVWKDDEAGLIDLKNGQRAFHSVIKPSFKDLEFEHDAVSRWYIAGVGKPIIVDPAIAFGQPTLKGTGIPTVRLADAVKAEGGNEALVARQFDVSVAYVRQAVTFERRLKQAA